MISELVSSSRRVDSLDNNLCSTFSHLAKISGPTGTNANGTRGSNGNFPEQTWKGNYLSISTARKSARAYINFLHHHDLPMKLQVFGPYEKSLSLEAENFRN